MSYFSVERLTKFPAAFTSAKRTPRGRPQAIAHRGYKAAHPENTMGAFKGAVEVGAHAIETDLRLSKDGVVVVCHVKTLQLRGCTHGRKLMADRTIPLNAALERTRRLWTAIGSI